MNKHLLLFFSFVPVCFCAMEKVSIYRRIAVSAQKRDLANDLTYENAIPVIEAGCKYNHLEYCLKAFARTYLRMDILKNYTQMKTELDQLREQSGNNPLVCDFIIIMKVAIDNWDTANPDNVFKYVDSVDANFMVFLKDDYFLGLNDPKEKAKKK